MHIDLGLIFAAIAGAGTVLGTLVAEEKYFTAKFSGAVAGILRDRGFESDVRHLNRQVQELQSAIVRLQDTELDTKETFEENVHRVDAKVIQAFNAINELRIRQAQLESAAQVLGAKFTGDGSISAILKESTN